jgi:SAM-dependent methyltransferase
MKPLDLNTNFKTIINCRICNSEKLQEILDLGIQPLANNLRSFEEQTLEIKFPLILLRCSDCTSIQLSVNVNPNLMFQEYLWITGTSQSARDHCDNLADYISEFSKEFSVILEIGSNDGTLLKALKEKTNSNLHGVDPAQNIIESFQEDGIQNHNSFFDLNFASSFYSKFGAVDVVIARNVLSHVPDILEVMNGIDLILAPEGICLIEFHEASKILTEIHYDSIYHEHTFYHSIKSMTKALLHVGLIPFDLIKSPISGGSFVLVSSRNGIKASSRLNEAEEFEESLGVHDEKAWINFAKLSKRNLTSINKYLIENSNRKIRAFGASARSSTLINAIGDNSKYLTAIADNNPLKWGKYSPGQHLLIDSPKEIIEKDTEIVFICPFNFETEITTYLAKELDWHGEVVLPLPNQIRKYLI